MPTERDTGGCHHDCPFTSHLMTTEKMAKDQTDDISHISQRLAVWTDLSPSSWHMYIFMTKPEQHCTYIHNEPLTLWHTWLTRTKLQHFSSLRTWIGATRDVMVSTCFPSLPPVLECRSNSWLGFPALVCGIFWSSSSGLSPSTLVSSPPSSSNGFSQLNKS